MVKIVDEKTEVFIPVKLKDWATYCNSIRIKKYIVNAKASFKIPLFQKGYFFAADPENLKAFDYDIILIGYLPKGTNYQIFEEYTEKEYGVSDHLIVTNNILIANQENMDLKI